MKAYNIGNKIPPFGTHFKKCPKAVSYEVNFAFQHLHLEVRTFKK